jgi:hypothetical protein
MASGYGLATSAGQPLAARVAQGAGGAVAIPAVLLITASFPEGRSAPARSACSPPWPWAARRSGLSSAA